MAGDPDAVVMALSGAGHRYAESGECHGRWNSKRGIASAGDAENGLVGVGNKKYIYTFGVVNST